MFGINKLKTDNKNLSKQVATLQRKSAPTTNEIISVSVPLYNFNNKSEIRTALNTVPELSSIIKYLSNAFSVGIYQIYKNDEIVDNKITELLNNPNPLQSGTEFKQSFIENLISFGVSYIFFNSKGLPEFTKSISILDSDKTNAYIGETSQKELLEAEKLNDIVKYFEYTTEGKTIKIESDNVVVVTMNTDVKKKGKYLNYQSPLKPLEKALMVTPAMYDSMQNLMNNGGMKGFVSNKTKDDAGNVPINEREKKVIQKAFKNYGSKSGQYDVAFTNSDLNYIAITSRIKDMLLPEQQNMIKTIIADVMGFDIAILNSNNANKYKSTDYQEARKSMYQEKLIPAANSFTSGLTKYFFKHSSEYIKLDYSFIDVFSEDEKIKYETSNIEINNIISINESLMSGYINYNNALYLMINQGYSNEDALLLINKPIIENSDDTLETNSGATQEQLAAQANLRGSVGGVQGILAIQASVQQGITSIESALATLVEIYGFNEDTARTILGN